MGKPMTLASLKRDLEEMTRRAALAECRAEVACRAVDDLAHMIDRYQADLSAIKDALRPVLDYMDKQWPGEIGTNLRRLKELCK